eukprot:m51a1_g3370 putative 5 exonuclease apollo (351) ;mRNA; r:458594-459702
MSRPRGSPFSGVFDDLGVCVDTFSAPARAYFLTHCHADHLAGLAPSWSRGPLHCSPATRSLLADRFGASSALARCAVPLDMCRPHCLALRASPADPAPLLATATLVPANHCPGSAMLLLECAGRRYLHTGDFRWCPGLADALAAALRGAVDAAVLDTTFCHAQCEDIPLKSEAARSVVELIERRAPEGRRVVIVCQPLGAEELALAVSRRWQCPVVVSEGKYRRLVAAEPDLAPSLTTDEAVSRFRLVERVPGELADAPGQDGPLVIAASVQWFRFGRLGDFRTYAPRPWLAPDGVWHVMYSGHSSLSELREFVKAVRPRELWPLTDCDPAALDDLQKLCCQTGVTATHG